MFIRSERLFLRPAWPEDRAELLALIGDAAIVRNLADAPWPDRAEDADRFIAAPQDRLLPQFLVTAPDGGGARVVGGCGLSRREGEVSLGYWTARAEWGRGYATEAVRALLSLARALGHGRILASHPVDNAVAGRVLDKVGFRRTGRVVERFSTGRGYAVPSREYELCLDSAAGCGGDDAAQDLRAA
ncbi:GNAT family N-acetyltransferase [Novosphingobium soli]|uniref:GNAT family N-acetyltransferase n=1 Tax=Novosphingobium soli TaxID=574956 RepID=A0ABV6CYV4_9SPHN